jgi:hypothetical protein
MRVLVLVEPRFPIPPEMFPSLLDGFAAWREQYRNSMESFEFFAGGGGGFGVINAPDEASLNRDDGRVPVYAFQRDNRSPHTRRGYGAWAVAGDHGPDDGRCPRIER